MPTTTRTSPPPTICRRRRSVVLAAEARPTYRRTPAPAPDTGRAAPGTPAPATTEGDATAASVGESDTATSVDAAVARLGLPVLAELPELASMLEALTVADRAMCQVLVRLARLVADDTVATTSGVSVEEWIGIVARHTRMDRRLLLRTARLLHRFPTLRAAAAEQLLSWPQLRGLSLTLRDCPTVLDGQIDGFLAQLLPHLADTDPDAVIDQTKRAIAEWTADLEPALAEGPARNHLHLQPRLDGTGGRFSGELDAVGLAIVDDATAPTRGQLDHPGGIGGARADNLLTRLTHTCPPAASDGTPSGTSGTSDHDGDSATTGASGDHGAVGPQPAVKLLLRCELDTLLDTPHTPAALLTRLVGGSLQLTAAAARRLVDAHGAELRTIIVDHGQVLGVGRATRVPPGWLRDATLAVHDTCTGPLCDRPALSADLDHATPWTPSHPNSPAGTTDVDNLGPLCATTNQAKETAGWRVHQHPDGRRTWAHPRTGLTTISLPATWRPPGTGPP
jgi:hypothetical protein